MSGTASTTRWERYDAERHAACGGNYVFLFKAFESAPLYSGVAQDFASRFEQHRVLFGAGGRTFMRRAFIEGAAELTHAGFAAQWDHYKHQTAEAQATLVSVPRGTPEDSRMGAEGAYFWEHEIVPLVLINEEDRNTLEKQIHTDFVDYYDRLVERKIDWSVGKAWLFGGPRTEPEVLDRLGGRQVDKAKALFRTMETMRNPSKLA